MDKQKLEDYYFERNSTIFSEMLDEDENYQRLKKAKLAAEKALQNVISKEAWKQYLALDEIGNELSAPDIRQCIWQVLPITKNYPNDLDAASGRHFFFAIGGDDAGSNTADCAAQKQGHDRCGLPEKSHGLYRKPGQD